MTPSRGALWLLRRSARLVPADQRRDWREEWESELAWCAANGRSRSEQLRRVRGAWRHACWLRAHHWRGEMIWQDLRYAARSLWKQPSIAAMAIGCLALAIGANVAIFTMVNAVLLRPLPFADPTGIVQLANGDAAATLSGPELVDLSRDTKSLSAVGAYAMADANVTGGRGDAERVRIARVSAGFFDVLRAALIAGRPFTAGEDRDGAPDVVVISRGLAARYFGDAAAAPGRTVLVNNVAREVVGVLPEGFDYPSAAVAIWVPLRLNPASPGERRNHQYRVIGRLATGATVTSTQSEIDAMKAAWQAQYPSLYDPKYPLVTTVMTIGDRVLGTSRLHLLTMLGAVATVLLIACVNVAALLVTQGESRRQERAICVAMGASRGRLASRVLSESLLIGLGGGMAGALLAVPAQRALVSLAPASIPRLADVRFDWTVFAFALAISLATTLLTGLIPLVRAMAGSEVAALRSAARGPAGARSRGTSRAHAMMAVGEVAMAVMLLGAAGLLTRSLLNLQRTDLGYGTDGVMTARISLPPRVYDDLRTTTMVQAVVDRLRAAPGVTQAAALAWTPMIDAGGMWSVVPEGGSTAAGERPVAAPQQSTPGLFQTLGIAMLRGRDFTTADTAVAPPVAIVNEAFGRLFWGGADPLGRRFRMDARDAKWVTVVGVVVDTRVEGITDPKPPVMYFPHAQAAEGSYFVSRTMTLAIRHTGSAAPVVEELRRAIREADADVPVSEVQSLNAVVGGTIARERFTGALVMGFAALAALLAGIGIYGVIAYDVGQRRFEIGVRMALGAAPAVIVAQVLRQGLLLTTSGLLLGLAGAVLAGRLLSSVLVGVEPIDPLVLGIVSLLTLALALAAVLAPSRRAIQVSPSEALRGAGG